MPITGPGGMLAAVAADATHATARITRRNEDIAIAEKKRES
jgi:hypothetical protein